MVQSLRTGSWATRAASRRTCFIIGPGTTRARRIFLREALLLRREHRVHHGAGHAGLDVHKAGIEQDRLILGGVALLAFGADEHVERLELTGERAGFVVV